MALDEVHQAGTSIQRINKSYNVNNVSLINTINERNIFKDNGQWKPDSNLHGNTSCLTNIWYTNADTLTRDKIEE